MLSSDRVGWSIQIPLSELVALQGLPARMDGLEKENRKMRKELDALHALYSQTLQAFADYRRENSKR